RIAEYFSGPPTKDGDLKCTGAECSLKGWLYLPKDADKKEDHKAVVYLHGHQRDRAEPCAIASYFLKQGWVVFAPVRRGCTGIQHDPPKAKPGDPPILPYSFTNTGVYIDDWARAQPGGSNDDKFEALCVDYLGSQKHDVDHALAWLADYRYGKGKLVDRRRIAIIGHSFGGALSVLSADGSFSVNPAAILDVSGA